MFRAKEVFRAMRRALSSSGYEAEAINYPSTLGTIESHADQVEMLLGRLQDISRVSFVAHSLGGLVARELLSRDAPWRDRIEVNRLVMIATPNQGAHIAESLRQLWAFRRLGGPVSVQLTREYVRDLPLPKCRFGIIAGARGDGRGYNPLLPGDNDARAIIRAIMALGHALGLEVLAEGVENEAQADFLRREGCDTAQGYLAAAPMPLAELAAWLGRRAGE